MKLNSIINLSEAYKPYKSKTSYKPYKSKTKYKPYKSKSSNAFAKRKNAKSGINKLRDFFYKTNKVLGHVNAVQKGTIVDRAIRVMGGKVAGSGLGKLDKK